MNAKEYLSQAVSLDKRINSKLEQISVLRNMATKTAASIHAEHVSGSKQRSTLENAVAKIIDLENEIDIDIDKLVELKREITALVSEIYNPSYRFLLELRYLVGSTWETIAEIMGYDLRWIYRLHGKALNEVNIVLANANKMNIDL